MYVLPLLLNVNIKWPVLNTVGLESGIMQGVAENSVCGPRKENHCYHWMLTVMTKMNSIFCSNFSKIQI